MGEKCFPEIAFVVYTRPRENRLPRRQRWQMQSGEGDMKLHADGLNFIN